MNDPTIPQTACQNEPQPLERIGWWRVLYNPRKACKVGPKAVSVLIYGTVADAVESFTKNKEARYLIAIEESQVPAYDYE